MTTETTPSTAHPIAPVRREVRVRCDPDTAFELFTAHLGAWWPLGTHSVFGAEGSVAFEDGTLVERRGSDTAVWGTVLHWERPVGFAMTWHPGHGPEHATEVTVQFAQDGAGTLVTLTHTGWERLADPEQARDDYDRGWPVVLCDYERRLGTEEEPGSARTGRWFALEHRPGPLLAEGGSVFAHPLFAEHVAFLQRLDERGWLVAAGPVDAAAGTGLTVVRVPADGSGGGSGGGSGEGSGTGSGTGSGAGSGAVATDIEALATTDDRSVLGGLLEVTVRSWDVRFVGTPS